MLIAAADVESQSDVVRQAALDAMADLDESRGLAVAIRYAQPGILSRTRPVAVAAIAKLARHNRPTALASLGMLLSDRERRTSQAAGEALVRIKDPAAVPLIQALQQTARAPVDRERMQSWLDALSK